jgi:hypothetical protein
MRGVAAGDGGAPWGKAPLRRKEMELHAPSQSPVESATRVLSIRICVLDGEEEITRANARPHSAAISKKRARSPPTRQRRGPF